MAKTVPLTIPLVLSVLPALVLLATMVAGYTSLKSDVGYIKENISQLVQDGKGVDSKLDNHEIRITLIESKKSSSIQSSKSIASAPTSHPQDSSVAESSAEVNVTQATPEPNPTPEPSPKPRVLPSPREIIEKLRVFN